jgi:hypothetical protein
LKRKQRAGLRQAVGRGARGILSQAIRDQVLDRNHHERAGVSQIDQRQRVAIVPAVHRRVRDHFEAEFEVGMNHSLEHLSYARRADEPKPSQLFLELGLAECADVTVARSERTQRVELRRCSTDENWATEPPTMHRFAGLREQPQRGFKLGAVERS